MNALHAYRPKTSWTAFDQDNNAAQTNSMDWSDLLDYQDVYQSVSGGWSDLRQTVVNKAPASLTKAPSLGRGAWRPSSEQEEVSCPSPDQVNQDSAVGSLWARVTGLVNEQWDIRVTHRDEIGLFNCFITRE